VRSREHGTPTHKLNRCKHSKQLLEHVERPMGEREKCQVRVERNFLSIPLIGRRVNTLARSNLLSSAYSISGTGPEWAERLHERWRRGTQIGVDVEIWPRST